MFGLLAFCLLEIDLPALVVRDLMRQLVQAFDFLEDVELELVDLQGPCVFAAERTLP